MNWITIFHRYTLMLSAASCTCSAVRIRTLDAPNGNNSLGATMFRLPHTNLVMEMIRF